MKLGLALVTLNSPYICAGFLYELFFTYPRRLVHPVSLMGRLITLFEESMLRSGAEPRSQKIMGAVMTGLLVFAAYAVFDTVEILFRSSWILVALNAFFAVAVLAAGSLLKECGRVLTLLERGDLEAARHQLSMLVTRDTSLMEEPEICRTTIETLSENLCDGVIAPLFFLFLGGIPLAMAYKMASTLDSMVGYKNDKYRCFGWAAARLDDLLAWIPARLSAGLVIIAAFMPGFDSRASARVWRRDRKKTESPNSGQPESAFAGALGIWFGGPVSYFGKIHEKPVIGDREREAGREDAARAVRLARVSALLGLAVFAAVEIAVRLR